MQGIKQNAQFRHNLLTLPPQTTGLFLTNEPGTIKGGFNGVAAQYTQPLSYLVVWKPNGIPALPTDGQGLAIPANGALTYSFTIPGLQNGVSYGVRVFVRGRFGFQTSPEAQGTMTPVAGVQLGTKAVGSKIKFKVGGVDYNWLVVNVGLPSSMYDTSCDGVWVLLENIYENRQWNSSNVNDYANSTINSYLNGAFVNLIEAGVKNQIKQVKIPYRPGSGTSSTVNSGANGLAVKAFTLSYYEVGWTASDYNNCPPVDGSKLEHFISGTSAAANTKRIAYYRSVIKAWWSRNPSTESSSVVFIINDGISGSFCSELLGLRPCIILPRTFMLKTAANSDGSFDPL